MPLSDLSGPICWILSCCIQPLFLFLFPIIMRCKGPPWRAPPSPPLAPPPTPFLPSPPTLPLSPASTPTSPGRYGPFLKKMKILFE